jgi:hypothetical protein
VYFRDVEPAISSASRTSGRLQARPVTAASKLQFQLKVKGSELLQAKAVVKLVAPGHIRAAVLENDYQLPAVLQFFDGGSIF